MDRATGVRAGSGSVWAAGPGLPAVPARRLPPARGLFSGGFDVCACAFL